MTRDILRRVRHTRARGAAWWLVAGLFLALAAGWAWQRRGTAPPHGVLRGANLLLITIDTLRADRLGAYGSPAHLTPTLDRLAADAVRFDRAWSHAPITLVAHASILTGLLPPHHGVRNNGSFRLGERAPTLATLLRQSGYRTGAFVGAFVLDARFGLNRGFDVYDDRYDDRAGGTSFHFVERTADRVLQAATAWIGRATPNDVRPWFAWVHLFDPHAPYRAPAAFAQAREPYDAEVAWTDLALGAALAELSRRNQLDRTLIAITADHGESLGDHGETTHGLFAYDATLRVPLIISGRGLDRATVSTPTSHVDIVPTILDLLGLDAPGNLDGRSRRTDMDGSRSEPRPIYLEALDANLTRGWAPLTAVVVGPWKYINLPEPELYDLDADPGERANRAAREPQRVRELQARLDEVAAAPVERDTARALDSAEAARLRSLGYVTGSARARTTYTNADDPKRLVALSEAFNTALDDFSAGRSDAALTSLFRVLGERPDFSAARLSAATILIATGRPLDAARLLREASETDRSSAAWLTKYGQALAAAGELQEARAVLARAVDTSEGDPEPLNELGVVLLRLGERDRARSAFERLLQTDRTAAGTWYNLGLLEMDARRLSAAAAAFRHVTDLDPGHAGAWQGLGAALASNDPHKAAGAWRSAVALDARDFDTLYNLGMLLAESGERVEAAGHLRRFLAEAPRDRYAADMPRVRAALRQVESAR